MAILELDAANAYAKAWNTLDCSEFISLLAPDARYASQYVFSELEGRDNIADYLSSKMETVKRTGSHVRAELAKTSSSFPNKDCVAIFQDDMNSIAAVVVFTVEANLVTRFDLCITELMAPILTGICPGLENVPPK